MGPNLRFALVASLLSGAGLFLHVRHSYEVIPQRQPLASFPHELGIWRGVDLPISREVLDTLGPGDFLSRTYEDESASGSVDLFMAYFPSQRTGDTIHSPEHCLPGSGWSPLESRQITVSMTGHASFSANRYLIGKQGGRALVLYWYWAHDRAVASQYWSKFYLIADSIRLNRSDGALIRVSALFRRGQTPDIAQQRLVTFASELVPLLGNYVPR